MKVLGIDCGAKHVGLALGFDDIATPLEIIQNDHKGLIRISELIDKEYPDVVVIGLPVNPNGNIPAYIENFRDQLEKMTKDKVKIVYVDERFSSNYAVKNSIKGGISRKRRKINHSMAACEIIHRYFNG